MSVDLFDPSTYRDGVPYGLIADMRAEAPVHWVHEPAVLGWDEGPGYWAVLTHELVNVVLRDPERFSSHIGATQIRDPISEDMLTFAAELIMDPRAQLRGSGRGGLRVRRRHGDVAVGR